LSMLWLVHNHVDYSIVMNMVQRPSHNTQRNDFQQNSKKM
jgi:hypothetical protein